jgi:hypothetical protein
MLERVRKGWCTGVAAEWLEESAQQNQPSQPLWAQPSPFDDIENKQIVTRLNKKSH